MIKITPEIENLVGENWQQKQDFQVRFLKKQGLKPYHKLLDYGCGVLRAGIPLIKYLDQYNYIGMEISEERRDIALKIICSDSGLSDKNPQIYMDDFGISNYKFDYIWIYQVLIHMSDEILEKAIESISRNMHSETKLFATVILNDTPKTGKWFEFPCVERPFEFYDRIFSKYGIVISWAISGKDIDEPMLNNTMLICRKE